MNLETQDVLFSYDPMAGIMEDAQAELQRFANTEQWREYYHRRGIQEERNRRNQSFPATERRRRELQLREDRRRARAMSGFSFVGAEPVTMERHRQVLRLPSPNWFSTDAVDMALDAVFGEDRTEVPKVNWLREGF